MATRIWSMKDYLAIVEGYKKSKGTDFYWTEVQVIDVESAKGVFVQMYDVVSCHLDWPYTGNQELIVRRWWHSEQSGYWPTIQEALAHANTYGREMWVVDMKGRR